MILLAVILICLAIFIAYMIVLFTTSAVVFSRVAFSLLAALAAVQSGGKLVPSGGFLNYLAWLSVILVVIYLVSQLPRVDQALKFMCTVIMSVFVVMIVVTFVCGIAGAMAGKVFQMGLALEIVIKLVCVAVATVSILLQGRKPQYDSPSNLIMYNLERVVASVLYGTAIAFLIGVSSVNVRVPTEVTTVVWILGSVAAFVVDIFLGGKDLLGLNAKDEVSMPK